jgi:probable F420-dependent oxidoreductase
VNRPIRIGIQLHPQQGAYDALRRAVYRAEQLGADLVYNWDHFFPLYGARDGEHFECWALLAAWAEQTRVIELGPLVTCNSYRNPQLLADMARTVDHVSGGRLVLGIGSGWFQRDYDEYGYEFGTDGSRGRDLTAALSLLKSRLDLLNPPPIRRIPILIAGVGERLTLPLVAEHADIWHARFPDHVDELEPKVDALLRSCETAGRDPADIEWCVGVDPNDLVRFLADEADACVEIGFTQFTLGVGGPSWVLGPEVEAWLEWRDARNVGQPVEPVSQGAQACS